MSERRSLGRLAREPLYNTRAVAHSTDVPADTFRAWERRYGLPRPFRTPTNQRLYSERDIGIITWLRERTDEGMTISQAIQRLRLEQPELFAPVAPVDRPQAPREPGGEQQPLQLQQQLLTALMAFDTPTAEQTIDDALARFSVEEFSSSIVEPVLHEIGDRWSRDELSVAAEHYATRLITRRLSAIFTMVSPVRGRGTILAACPPGEEHEVGLLVLAIALSRRGLRVTYLGANVPVNDIVATARAIRPDLVCLSVSTAHAAAQAFAVADTLDAAFDPPVPVVLGGYAFGSDDEPRPESSASIVAGSAGDVVDRISELIDAW